MLFTNKCLEISHDKRGNRVLELSNIYNNCISLGVDRHMNDKIKYVNNCFHKHLSLAEFGDNRFRLMNQDDDDIYIILDTLEYKVFTTSAKVNFLDDNFQILRKFNMTNRSNKVAWDIMIIKVKNKDTDKPTVLEYMDTASNKKYIVVKDGRLTHYNKYTFLEHYGDLYKAE